MRGGPPALLDGLSPGQDQTFPTSHSLGLKLRSAPEGLQRVREYPKTGPLPPSSQALTGGGVRRCESLSSASQALRT